MVIIPRIFADERGYFFESFSQRQLNESVGYPVCFVQDNQSFSSYGVLRGLHAQTGEHAQAKLVRVPLLTGNTIVKNCRRKTKRIVHSPWLFTWICSVV